MEKVRAHAFISGRVQGVFYRAWTRKVATSLGLTGWARNLSDGRVEVLFEGSKKDIEEMIRRAKKGPNTSGVENIVVSWGKATGKYADFEIKPGA